MADKHRNEKIILSGEDAEIFIEATKIENVKPLSLNELDRMGKNWELFKKAMAKGERKNNGLVTMAGSVENAELQ